MLRTGPLQLAENTTDTVATLKHPTTQSRHSSFMGLCQVFKGCVPNLPASPYPLTKTYRMANRSILTRWIKRETAELASLKKTLITASVLAPPKSEGLYTLDNYACDNQIECVLLQEREDGSNCPVVY